MQMWECAAVYSSTKSWKAHKEQCIALLIKNISDPLSEDTHSLLQLHIFNYNKLKSIYSIQKQSSM